MKRLFIFAVLGVIAFAILAGAAVSLGGLNQDEGWYLYAARLVGEGKLPYRDFFFTQGPVMPIVYSAAVAVWRSAGLLGARVLTMLLGAVSIVFAIAFVRRAVPEDRRSFAAVTVLFLLGGNLYHLYYLAIPKTYALAALFVNAGFFLLTFRGAGWQFLAGLALALAAGTRISLGSLLAVCGCCFLFRREWRQLVWFSIGGFLGLGLVYGPFLANELTRAGLVAAQRYHTARGGFDPVFTVGSVSRLVRWYLPVFIVLGLGVHRLATGRRTSRFAVMALLGFAAVFAVQMLAPFPYEDYQVPVMALLAVFATAAFAAGEVQPARALLLVLGLSWAGAFGCPMLEKWTTNGQDRFWTRKKGSTELAQLQEAATVIETLDPGGGELLTQDLYLAIETGRRVPEGLEMGPFSYRGENDGVGLSKSELLALLESAPCRIAALSGYSFAITTPRCDETAMTDQLEFWRAVKRHYELVYEMPSFGQNATTLLILRRKE